MILTLMLKLEVSADEHHSITAQEREHIRTEVKNAVLSRYENGFNLTRCFVDSFEVTQEGFVG